MLFAAFCEEIVFRGLLQARFIQRYGLYRAMFLVGIVWAAYHFFYEFSFLRSAHVEVFEKLGFRLFMCVVLSFVFGWLTLRAGSVFPAAVALGLYNVLGKSSLGPPFPGEAFVRVALWAVLAYVLFRYCPVSVKDSLEPGEKLPSLESAT
jgi:membrane protease YdiL (CAAX protease family)